MTSTTNTAELEVVGEAGSMPGSSGFTMAALKADAVPIGTKLVTAASAQAAIDDAWSRAGGTAYALVVEWQARAQAAEARADRLAILGKRLSERLCEALERAYVTDAEWVKTEYPNGVTEIYVIEAALQQEPTTSRAALQDQPK